MLPKSAESGILQEQLFRNRLDQILDSQHALFKLAKQIDWGVFDLQFGGYFQVKLGRPALSTRLIVGLHYLKHAYDVSDEDVVDYFLENPYWQYFCGFEFFQHSCPLDRSSLTRWRKRLGPGGMEKLLGETLETAKRQKLITSQDLKRVVVDTTVQEKAIAFPTDARLYHKMRRHLVTLAKKRGIELRQSYERLSKKALFRQGRYAHALQMKRARKQTKCLRTLLGRVLRDLQRKVSATDTAWQAPLALATRIYQQRREDKHKVYSIHAPEVECIAKGKIHKRYEFGCKVALTSTAKKSWFVGAKAFHDNPYDGHTLNDSLSQMQRLTGHLPEHAYCDQGYRGDTGVPPGIIVHLCGKKKKLTRTERLWQKRRSSIEPKIGHLKTDNRLNRNFLLGKQGDAINALLAAAGANINKLLRAFCDFFQSSLLLQYN